MKNICVKFLYVSIFYCSCHQKNYKISNTTVDSVVMSSIDTLEKISWGIDTQDINSKLSKKYNDSTFNYRLKAYDTLEFGSHKNYEGKYYNILYSWFKVFVQEDPYYGVYDLSLISDKKAYPFNNIEDDLKDISAIIDKKYSSSSIVNKSIHYSNSLLILECELAVSPDEFDKTSIPKDAGDQYIYKTWTTNEIVVELGYRVDYDWNLKEKGNNKTIEFSRKYKIYINFKSTYLRKQIDDRNRKEKQKVILDNSSKF